MHSISPTPSNSAIISSLTKDSISILHRLPIIHHHHPNTTTYNETTIRQLQKTSSKSSSSLRFKLLSDGAYSITDPKSEIALYNKDIQIIKSIISHEKSLHHFSFTLKSLGPYNLDFLASLLKNGPLIITLNLEISNLQVTTSSSLQFLLLAFKTLKHVSHLTLSFSQGFHPIYNLLSSLKALRSLTSLSLKLPAPQDSFRKWPKYLSHISHLTALSLAFTECANLTNEDLPFLFSPLSKFTEITTIKIFLNHTVNCTAIQSFFHSIKDLKKLSKISLEIPRFNLRLQYQHERIFAAFALPNPQLLQELTLDISNTYVSSVDLDVLFTALERFQSLKTLNLNLEYNSMTYESAQKLGACIWKLQSLTSLDLNLTDCSFYGNLNEGDTDAVGRISGGLMKLKQLLSLKLNFTNFNETPEQDIQKLGRGISECSLLENLTLIFNDCWSFTETYIEILTGYLGYLKKLRVLSLDFSNVEKMTNANLGHIADEMSYLTNLKELELNFSSCEGIDGDGVEALGEGFENLEELEKVNLSFPASAAKENLDGMESLFEVFRKLDLLKIITVNMESVGLLKSRFDIPGKEVKLCIL